eukprot:TRINITY_DN1732_c0_g1_i3.p1 TRINITY_DN1732_c0_g1~~TRINITY_DN1732_c0_g1_i3.p1  ORF type:complete len:270 (-),score=14.69 TRINITY_DN1732_c0_g1_i3:406-1215(-)
MDDYALYNGLRVCYDEVNFKEITSCVAEKNYSWTYTAGIPTMLLPCGLTVLLVEDPRYVNLAVNILRSSMIDNIISLDFEWRPDGLFKDVKYHSISLVQVATFHVCALFRVCNLGNALPTSVKQLLTSPQVTVVGCGMSQNDEPKMKHSFGFGVEIFPALIDLQRVAQVLGYTKVGLAGMCRSLYKADMPNKSLSDWEAPRLSIKMILYAALDAFLTGHILRKLKQLHFCGVICPQCRYHIGVRVQHNDVGYDGQIKQNCTHCHRKTAF